MTASISILDSGVFLNRKEQTNQVFRKKTISEGQASCL